MKTVRLEGSKVVEIIPDNAIPVSKWYGEEFAANCIEAPDEVNQGWFYTDGKWTDVVVVDIEAARAEKTSELSAACNAAIENGLDIQLGETTEHFNYSEKDQLNIKEMFDAVRMGATEYPYQSDTGECRVYSAAEIALIYQTLAGHKTGNLTYYHQLKSYVGTLETEDEVAAVVYGQALTGDYLAHYTDMMAVVQAQMAAVLSAG